MVGLLLIFSSFTNAQTSDKILPVLSHRRVPESPCELIEKGTLQSVGSQIVVKLESADGELHQESYRRSFGFLEYDPRDLRNDASNDLFYEARDAGFKLRTGRSAASWGKLPTLQDVMGMVGPGCGHIRDAIALLEANPLPAELIGREDPGITPPVVTNRVNPQYTEEAKKAHIQGEVLLALVVREDGIPSYVFVSHSLDPELDNRAIQAVRQWRFKPAMKGEHPVAAYINVAVEFHLLY